MKNILFYTSALMLVFVLFSSSIAMEEGRPVKKAKITKVHITSPAEIFKNNLARRLMYYLMTEEYVDTDYDDCSSVANELNTIIAEPNYNLFKEEQLSNANYTFASLIDEVAKRYHLRKVGTFYKVPTKETKPRKK